MKFVWQNIIPVTVVVASVAVIAILVVDVAATSRHIHGGRVSQRSTFSLVPGREIERDVSPDKSYVAVVYSSDGVGVSPIGSTVTLQPLDSKEPPSSPMIVAFINSETLPFQGIAAVNWVGRRTLEIQSYNDLSVLQPNWRGIQIQAKYRDAGAEMP